MNTNRITFAIIAAALAAAAVAIANVRVPVAFDSLIGFGTVIALIALAATDYRSGLRRLISGR